MLLGGRTMEVGIFQNTTIDSGEATSIYTSDLDGDGDLDVLTVGQRLPGGSMWGMNWFSCRWH